MSTLPNASKFYYQSKDTFKSEMDIVHAFPRTDFETGMHMQEFFEINIITRGSGRLYIEDGSVDTRVGDVFVIPPKVSHGFEGGNGFDVFHVLISDKFLNKNMTELQTLPSFFTLFNAEPIMRGNAKSGLHLRLNDSQFQDLNAILTQTLKYRNQKDPFHCFARSGIVMMLISFLCKVYTGNTDASAKMSGESDQAFMRVISYIHEHYSEKISIETLAAIAYLSRSTFIRRFNKICKMSPSDYIIKCRLEAAEYMLMNTSCTLVEIAFKCGFYDASHFSHTFKKIYGVYPIEYRTIKIKS